MNLVAADVEMIHRMNAGSLEDILKQSRAHKREPVLDRKHKLLLPQAGVLKV